MEELVCNGSTTECVDFFKSHYENFKPVKKLIVYFDNSNLLLSNYVLFNNDIHMVVENALGQTIQLAGVNCGYNGTGPRGTKEILKTIGLSDEKASSIIEFTRIEIDFTKEPFSIKADNNSFFQNPSSHNSNKIILCEIGENFRKNLLYRHIYLWQPQKSNLQNFMNCVSVSNPVKISYVLTKDIMPESEKYQDIFENRYKANKDVRIKLIVYGKLFTIYCYVDVNDMYVLMRTLYDYMNSNYNINGSMPDFPLNPYLYENVWSFLFQSYRIYKKCINSGTQSIIVNGYRTRGMIGSLEVDRNE